MNHWIVHHCITKAWISDSSLQESVFAGITDFSIHEWWKWEWMNTSWIIRKLIKENRNHFLFFPFKFHYKGFPCIKNVWISYQYMNCIIVIMGSTEGINCNHYDHSWSTSVESVSGIFDITLHTLQFTKLLSHWLNKKEIFYRSCMYSEWFFVLLLFSPFFIFSNYTLRIQWHLMYWRILSTSLHHFCHRIYFCTG